MKIQIFQLFFGLILMGLLSTTPALANDGGETGGGGGGIKIGDKVYTMAQAGLKFPNDPEPFLVDFEAIVEATEILKSLEKYCPTDVAVNKLCNSKLNLIMEKISSNAHIYKKVEVVDNDLFDRLKLEYQKYVSKLPITGSFILAAFTENKTTYLFPDFFNGDPQTKAIYLIHEAIFFHNPKFSLDEVLQIEVAIVALLKDANPSTIRALKDSLMPITTHPYEPNFETQLAGNFLEYLKQKGITVSFDQILGSSNEYLDELPLKSDCRYYYGKITETSVYELSKNRNIDPDFFKVFFHMELRIDCPGYGYVKSPHHYKVSDLEFHGSQIFSKSEGKLVADLFDYRFSTIWP